MKINFFYEETPFRLKQGSSIRAWLKKIILSHNHKLEELNYIFCSDSYLHKINLERLKHDSFTDIITFDNSTSKKTIASDIFISVDRVKSNSLLFATLFYEELLRVIVHGPLHLMGWEDTTEELKIKMRKKENKCLSLL